MSPWTIDTIVSAIAATLTTVAFIPQAIHIIRRKDTAAVSLMMYATFSTGVFFWGIFGILIDSWPIIIANVITFALAITIVALKIRYG